MFEKLTYLCISIRVGDISLCRKIRLSQGSHKIFSLFRLHRRSQCVPGMFEGETLTIRQLFLWSFCGKFLAANTPRNLYFSFLHFWMRSLISSSSISWLKYDFFWNPARRIHKNIASFFANIEIFNIVGQGRRKFQLDRNWAVCYLGINKIVRSLLSTGQVKNPNKVVWVVCQTYAMAIVNIG